MNTGKFFIFNALVYIILLMFIYFSKRRYKSKENKIYSILIIKEIDLTIQKVKVILNKYT